MKAAEQARLAYLGSNQAECVPWDELKPEMWERWQWVVDVAQKPIYAELEAARKELADWKAAPCIRCWARNRCGGGHNAIHASIGGGIRVPFSDAVIEKMADGFWKCYQKSGTSSEGAIRAALVAGGIDPCAVPEYAPEDVAFGSERASDEELEHVYEQGREFGELINLEGIRAVRARVEAPLLAEIARLGNQWNMAARAESDRTAELDAANARVAELEAKIENQRMNLRQLHEARERDALERVRLESQIAELKAEAKANIDWQETMVLDLRNKDAELAAVTAERDEMCQQQTKRCMGLRRCFDLAFRLKNKYRAELAALRQPVDADAWKTPLEMTAPNKHKIKIHGDGDAVSIENTAYIVNTTVGVVLDPADAARAAQWLASYAAAHGCPVVLTAPVESRKAKVRWDISRERLAYIVENDDSDSSERPSDIAYRVLLNHAVIDAPTATPTDAQVEALARVLYEAWGASGEMTYPVSWRNSARAAYANIGRGPVDECKECAKRPKNVVTSFNFTFNYDTGTWQVVNRAALEGE